jgi:hypothetical protein
MSHLQRGKGRRMMKKKRRKGGKKTREREHTNIFPSMQCASGSQLNTSEKRSIISELYFAFTSPSNPYILFRLSLSWFPGYEYSKN